MGPKQLTDLQKDILNTLSTNTSINYFDAVSSLSQDLGYTSSDIKSAILSLKTDGLIELSNDGNLTNRIHKFIPEYIRLGKEPLKLDLNFKEPLQNGIQNERPTPRVFSTAGIPISSDGVIEAKISTSVQQNLTEDDIEQPLLTTPINDFKDQISDIDNQYLLLLNNNIIFSSSSKEEIETYIQSILYNENDEYSNVALEDLVIFKKINLKAGVFLDE